MRLTFLGAAHEVTGSKTLLEAAGKNILVDCGMEQGADIYENQEIPVSPTKIDAILLTHAHIDHSGLIPLMYAQGFRGSVFMTKPTKELCQIMLLDSAHIQEYEAEWRNRKAKRAGGKPYTPLYTSKDVQGVLRQCMGLEYDVAFDIFDGITVRFVDAGHLLGSASIEVVATEGNETRKIVFSGDIGNENKPILKCPSHLTEADYVIMESTYGDRSHGVDPDYVTELAAILNKTLTRGGNVVIPTFAVGRMQEMLYFLREIKEKELVDRDFPVYIDSPLAVEATQIFQRCHGSYFDEETSAMIDNGINPLDFPNLQLTSGTEQSKLINTDETPKVILSASGMCEAGRIRHHLKHNLWKAKSTILFVGYQVKGTLGRAILEGTPEVKLFNDLIEVRAEVRELTGTSSHADNNALLRWADSFSPKPQRLFVVHGEDSVCDIFATRVKGELGIPAVAPYSGACWDLIANVCLDEGNSEKLDGVKAKQKQQSEEYVKVLESYNELRRIIQSNEHTDNYDLKQMKEDILKLCNKWKMDTEG